jgi:hypothetical protein
VCWQPLPGAASARRDETKPSHPTASRRKHRAKGFGAPVGAPAEGLTSERITALRMASQSIEAASCWRDW